MGNRREAGYCFHGGRGLSLLLYNGIRTLVVGFCINVYIALFTIRESRGFPFPKYNSLF